MKTQLLQMADRTLIPKCFIASSFRSRLMGLMGRTEIAGDEAVLFPKCNSIHTFFMRFRIDVVVLDKSGKVLRVVEAMKPWKMMLPMRHARHIIEMKANRAQALGIKPGVQLQCTGVWA